MSEINRLHDEAMDYAALALFERAKGNPEKAAPLFERALEYEVAAIDALDRYVEPTYSVLHRSAATLALDCKQYRTAEKLAAKALAKDPPRFIAEELYDVLDQANANLRWQFAVSNPKRPAPMRLTFSGKPVIEEYGIMAGFLAKALPAFETAVASIGASLNESLDDSGDETEPIPNRDAYSLLITNVSRVSFGLEFEDASYDTENAPYRSQPELAVERIKKLLEASLETADDHSSLAYAADGIHQRALKHLREFLDVVAKNEAVCALRLGDKEVKFNNCDQVRKSADRLGRIGRAQVRDPRRAPPCTSS